MPVARPCVGTIRVEAERVFASVRFVVNEM